MLRLDRLLSDEEVAALLATASPFRRSAEAGAFDVTAGLAARVESPARTSATAWCLSNCEAGPLVRRVFARMEELTGVPRAHFEPLQVLRYEAGQRYAAHHDYSDAQRDLPCGPRVLTLLLYLSNVEDGGDTAFPLLQPPLVVAPAKGSAVLWPSVLADALTQKDERTLHEARPVRRGVKYAANAWIHLRDYRQPHHWGCAGAFDDGVLEEGGPPD